MSAFDLAALREWHDELDLLAGRNAEYLRRLVRQLIRDLDALIEHVEQDEVTP